MISGFVVKKGRMTSVYLPDGKKIAVTACLCPFLVVTQVKSQDKDKYSAIQVAFGDKRRINKSISAKLTKLKIDKTPKGFREFNITTDKIPAIGDKITIDSVFTPGDAVGVTGISKGHGFAGVIKRYGFHRQPVTGGQSDRVRAPGSIGAQTPGKVVKGKKMPGHYGNVTKTIKGLKIINIDQGKNQVLISGSIPGSLNSWITLKKLTRN